MTAKPTFQSLPSLLSWHRGRIYVHHRSIETRPGHGSYNRSYTRLVKWWPLNWFSRPYRRNICSGPINANNKAGTIVRVNSPAELIRATEKQS